MAYCHSVASVHKVLLHQTPWYLHQVLTTSLASGVHHRYPTTAAGQRQVAPARLVVADTSLSLRLPLTQAWFGSTTDMSFLSLEPFSLFLSMYEAT